MEHVTVTDLAKQLGISRRATWYWIYKLKLGSQRVGATGMVLLTDEEIAIIKDNVGRVQRLPGVSVGDLSAELGMTRQGLWRIIHKLELRKTNNVGRGVKFNPAEADMIREQVRHAD
jgi:biotin operon repressor